MRGFRRSVGDWKKILSYLTKVHISHRSEADCTSLFMRQHRHKCPAMRFKRKISPKHLFLSRVLTNHLKNRKYLHCRQRSLILPRSLFQPFSLKKISGFCPSTNMHPSQGFVFYLWTGVLMSPRNCGCDKETSLDSTSRWWNTTRIAFCSDFTSNRRRCCEYPPWPFSCTGHNTLLRSVHVGHWKAHPIPKVDALPCMSIRCPCPRQILTYPYVHSFSAWIKCPGI